MKNSVSDQKFYIESEENEEKVSSDKGDDVNGYNSDSSSTVSSIESEQHNRPGSYNTSWPQSYRQSIDMYSSVQSPSIGFLGSPSLSQFFPLFFPDKAAYP
ncbi:hypothetical protein IFM89_032297 [Coptis chinensis]|uniref:Uncharacterized protein n=1 Tax=Coptis chinensis TaxID=261450 RepID=A0A835LFU4_9MAGN|nr:hypothetical protein IFM89_032297 [Coptis chinensis]